MGVRKGTDNFAESRATNIAENLARIRHELAKQKKRRIPYPDLTSLVADISEKTGLHRTTLTRKRSRYLGVLLQHLAEQPGAAALVDDKSASAPLLSAKLYDARLEIRTLKNRLEIAEKRATLPPTDEQASSTSRGSNTNAKADWYTAFADTAMVLKLLIDRMNSIDETLRVDVAKKQILDLSAPSHERVVAGPERSRWFVEYYKKLSDQEKGGAGGAA